MDTNLRLKVLMDVINELEPDQMKVMELIHKHHNVTIGKTYDHHLRYPKCNITLKIK